MKSKPKKPSKTLISDRIAEALTVKPKADIEDDQIFGTKPKTLTRGDISSSESEDELAISDFRKQNVNLLSEINKKYEGKVVSQKDLLQEDSDEIESDEDDELQENGKLLNNASSEGSESEIPSKSQIKLAGNDSDTDSEAESEDYSITKFQNESDSDDSGDEEGIDDDNDDEGEGYDISQLDKPVAEDFEHVKKQNVSEEAKKGASVRNQLLLWEGFLEMRIHLQRCMNTANQMPMPETFGELKSNDRFIAECNTTKSNVSNILDKFLQLQNMLFKKFPETKNISSIKEQKGDNKTPVTKEDSDEEIQSDTDNEEIPSDTEPEDNNEEQNNENAKKPANVSTKKRKLEDYENEIAKSHKAFKPFRDSTIQKWNEKTRLATAANLKNTPVNTILQQISYILSDRSKLVRRTQLKRSEYDIVEYTKPTQENVDEEHSDNLVLKGRKDDDEYIPEIFDDSDFYHQLLRELIECKSADISDPVQLSRQWIALQQMRSKMKRKVDTKATKGRKIKYVVHNQLVNYMAPEKCNTWNDESTNELYSSLFGKMYEQNNIGLNANLDSNIKIKE